MTKRTEHEDAHAEEDAEECPDGWLCGYAAHYGVGTMEISAGVHGLPQVRCMVASSYYTLGVWLEVVSYRTGATALCRVSDVTKLADVQYNRSRGRVIEFGERNILEMCALTEVGQMPPSDCSVRVRVAR